MSVSFEVVNIVASNAAVSVKVEGGSHSVEEVHPNDGDYLSLEQCQGVVGGYIEHVRMPMYPNHAMLVNEMGRIENMELNEWASRLALRPIVGDVIVCDVCMLESS